MVYHECPKDVLSMPDRPFSYHLKAGIPLSLCVHFLTDRGLNLGDTEQTARQSKTGFSFSFTGTSASLESRYHMFIKNIYIKKKKK